MQWEDRIVNYVRVTGFPRSLFVSADGRVVGTWIMGNDYRVKSEYYGGYPAGYLRRIKALFPDKRRVLHLFSGKVDLATLPGDTVDINADLAPTYVDDAQHLENVPLGHYDLVLADPPYSIEDAERYQTTMVKRNAVMAALRGLSPGAHVVWLDQVLPMYRKDAFAVDAVIGMVKSTNHRFRMVTIFRRADQVVSERRSEVGGRANAETGQLALLPSQRAR
jgi:16S rRNA G966 N2-methylase RsmD